jgi:hypothetical protein
MWKIVAVLVPTALAILMARLSYHAPLFDGRLGTHVLLGTTSLTTPPLMYAGIRG